MLEQSTLKPVQAPWTKWSATAVFRLLELESHSIRASGEAGIRPGGIRADARRLMLSTRDHDPTVDTIFATDADGFKAQLLVFKDGSALVAIPDPQSGTGGLQIDPTPYRLVSSIPMPDEMARQRHGGIIGLRIKTWPKVTRGRAATRKRPGRRSYVALWAKVTNPVTMDSEAGSLGARSPGPIPSALLDRVRADTLAIARRIPSRSPVVDPDLGGDPARWPAFMPKQNWTPEQEHQIQDVFRQVFISVVSRRADLVEEMSMPGDWNTPDHDAFSILSATLTAGGPSELGDRGWKAHVDIRVSVKRAPYATIKAIELTMARMVSKAVDIHSFRGSDFEGPEHGKPFAVRSRCINLSGGLPDGAISAHEQIEACIRLAELETRDPIRASGAPRAQVRRDRLRHAAEGAPT
jgi:hypothetical protein